MDSESIQWLKYRLMEYLGLTAKMEGQKLLIEVTFQGEPITSTLVDLRPVSKVDPYHIDFD